MTTATVSSKYQIVLPKALRNNMDISVGMKFEVIPFENRIELIPLSPMRSLKGSLKGIDTDIIRESDRT